MARTEYLRLSFALSYDKNKNLTYSHFRESLIYAFLIATAENGRENAKVNKAVGVCGINS